MKSHLPDEPGVYQITHLVTGDTYIGSARSIRVRCDIHRTDLLAGCHHNKKLSKIVSESGIELEFSVLQLTKNRKRLPIEGRWIRKLNPTLNERTPSKTENRKLLSESERTVSVGGRIDPALRDALQALADADRRTFSFMLEEAVRAYLDGANKGKKK